MTLYESLLAHESMRLTVYDDATGKPIQAGSHVVGNPTIGVGTLICAPGGITEDEAHYLLSNRVQIAQKAADSLVPGLQKDDPARFDVLTEMAFQMGGDGLAKFTNTLKAIREKRWDDASNGMLNSLWAKQTPSRAHDLARIIKEGQ